MSTTATINDGYEGLVTQNQDGLNSLSVLVSGVHCALCIQKIESTLKANKNIKNARLNFSTGRLNIAWDGTPDNANTYIHDIENLGYNINPYNPDIEKNTNEHENRFLLLCLGVAGFAMGNIMLLSVGLWVTDSQTMGEATRNLLHWVSAIIAIPTVIFSGRPFFQSAWSALKNKHTNMDVPISLAVILATAMSLFETINHGEHVYFDSAVMLMFFLLIGRYLDFQARRNARGAATNLLETLSGFATILENEKPKRILIRDVKEDMTVLVAMGEKIPVDGTVIVGDSSLDTSLITGETLPKDTKPGDTVFAGTINQTAPLTIKVSKAADNSLLADIVRLMEKAEQGQAHYVRLADKAASLYTPIVHSFAAIAFILWFFIFGAAWQESLLIAITVLIITCPCALGLAVPVVQVLATGLLMKRGVLVKSGDALERLAKIDTILFDKTGTLTIGKPRLTGQYDPQHLQLAASLAIHSKHPLSQALTGAFDGEYLKAHHIQEHAGKGLEAVIDDKAIKLGSNQWCGNLTKSNSELIQLYLSVDRKPVTVLTFQDYPKQDALHSIRNLQKTGLNLAIVSGDRAPVVERIARALGIDRSYAEQTPPQKHEILENLKEQGKTILMVGDGLNDAPVLAAADISMAPGTAVDMAQNAADIVFMGDRLAPVNTTYKTARCTQKLVKQNFALAILYNCIAIPLAFCGLVTPMIAAIAMSGSSLIVIANSYRLKVLT